MTFTRQDTIELLVLGTDRERDIAPKAAALLLVATRPWLYRQDFRDGYIDYHLEHGDVGFAKVEWEKIGNQLALGSFPLPSSGSELSLLTIACSLAGFANCDLRDCLIGIDEGTALMVIAAIAYTQGLTRIGETGLPILLSLD